MRQDATAIRDLFAAGGHELGDLQAEALTDYLTLLVRWSSRVNLTGFHDPLDAADRLLYDAVEVAPLVPRSASIIDVGAGAGGLAAALAVLRPDVGIRLVEPRQKRAAFLRRVRHELSLERWDVVQARAESIGSPGVDVAYARAVMPPERWLPLGRRLVRDGGAVLCLSAEPLDVAPAGLTLTASRRYVLPWSRAPRAVTLFRAGDADTIHGS
jgi:16S rRNA (guanine527-N7)-methyltransferase